MDCPTDFGRLVARLHGHGLFAQFRRWAEGNTVIAASRPERVPDNEIVVFERAICIGRRQGGAYYTFDFVETDEGYDEEEVVEYVARRLSAHSGELEVGATLREIVVGRGLFPLRSDRAAFYRVRPLEQRLALYLARKFRFQALHRRYAADLARAPH
jgi:hypothetical protein